MGTTAVINGLDLLAKKLEADGFPLQALHCLQGMLSLQLLPDQETRTHCTVGRLLIQHTNNLKAAKQHLQQAQQLGQQLLGNYCLRCEICSHLAHLCKLTAEMQFCEQALRQGLELCKQGTGSTEGAQLARWTCHFYMELANTSLCTGNNAAAVECVDSGLLYASENKLQDLQLVFLLLGLQMAMLDSSSKQGVDQNTAGITKLLSEYDGSDRHPAFMAYAQLHLYVMQVLQLLRTGRLMELHAPGEADKNALMMMENVEALMEKLEGASTQQIGYSWLPSTAVRALACLCAAVILGNIGKIKAALEHLATGEAALQTAFRDLGLPDGFTEQSMDPGVMWQARPLLVLRLMLGAQRAQLDLLQCAYAAARNSILALIAQAMMFPLQLQSMQPVLHVLAGQYAHNMGHYQEAVQHLELAVHGFGTPAQAPMPCAMAACSFLAQNQPDSVSQAISALGELYDATLAASGVGMAPGMAGGSPAVADLFQDLGAQEKTCLQFATAAIRDKLGYSVEARLLLSRALKLAHKKLNNHLLVCSIMVCMAPLQMAAGDAPGALQMLDSSKLLTHNNRDLHTTAAVLKLTGELLHTLGQESKAQDAQASLERQDAELARRMAEAQVPLSDHQAVLRWGLPPAGDPMVQ